MIDMLIGLGIPLLQVVFRTSRFYHVDRIVVSNLLVRICRLRA